jgi:hypothetical protein
MMNTGALEVGHFFYDYFLDSTDSEFRRINAPLKHKV